MSASFLLTLTSLYLHCNYLLNLLPLFRMPIMARMFNDTFWRNFVIFVSVVDKSGTCLHFWKRCNTLNAMSPLQVSTDFVSTNIINVCTFADLYDAILTNHHFEWSKAASGDTLLFNLFIDISVMFFLNKAMHYIFLERSYCHPNPCLNGGSCSQSDDSYICLCQLEYKGKNCEGIY